MPVWLQTLVSQDKCRYKDQNYNLDLTYITSRIVAMSFPASGLETTYRNPLQKVREFINNNHSTNYLVMNLSSRQYDYSQFDNQVIDYQWNDHQAPLIQVLFDGVLQIHEYLKRDINNVVFVHCNAGKGRTGTMIVCFLLFTDLFTRPIDARTYYSYKRFNSLFRGVTQPSQIRYINYFMALMNGFRKAAHASQLVSIRPKCLKKLVINGFINKRSTQDALKPVLKIFQVEGNQKIYDQSQQQDYVQHSFMKKDSCFVIELEKKVVLIGDIQIKVEHDGMRVKELFRMNLNMNLEKNHIVMKPNQIDPDKFYKKVNDSFYLELFFDDICESKCFENANTNQPCNICQQYAEKVKQEKEVYRKCHQVCQTQQTMFQNKMMLYGDVTNEDLQEFQEFRNNNSKEKEVQSDQDEND